MVPSQEPVTDNWSRLRSLEAVSVLQCSGCGRGLAVVTDHKGSGIFWYPTPGAGDMDPAVCKEVASCYDEGVRCLSIGAARAAAVMFRSALSLIVKDRGGPRAKSERHLKTALGRMKEDGTLHPKLWEWADHLNQLGNEGAHPEDHDPVTVEEAKGLAMFLRRWIELEYEWPARLERDRELGAPREQPSPISAHA